MLIVLRVFHKRMSHGRRLIWPSWMISSKSSSSYSPLAYWILQSKSHDSIIFPSNWKYTIQKSEINLCFAIVMGHSLLDFRNLHARLNQQFYLPSRSTPVQYAQVWFPRCPTRSCLVRKDQLQTKAKELLMHAILLSVTLQRPSQKEPLEQASIFILLILETLLTWQNAVWKRCHEFPQDTTCHRQASTAASEEPL